MIDSKTQERIVAHTHEVYGPYIRVSTHEDGGALEDILNEQHYALYWKNTPKELETRGGSGYYFWGAADPVKLQAILDEIDFLIR